MKDLKIQKIKRSVCTRALFYFLINQEYAYIHNFLLFLNDDLLSSLSLLGWLKTMSQLYRQQQTTKILHLFFPLHTQWARLHTDNHVSRKVLYSL